jgi:hypothetical protein
LHELQRLLLRDQKGVEIKMLSGYFENCYGIKQFTLPNIGFNRCNKAIIYAPNGVMKTSFAKVFEDISKGTATSDRIFKDSVSRYSITHYTSHYEYSSSANDAIPQSDNIYVINSFADKFEFNKETVGTLLADEGTRNQYNVLMGKLNDIITEIVNKLREITGLTKPQIKIKLINDLGLQTTADWPDIMEAIRQIENKNYSFLYKVLYSELFNEKTMAVYENADFQRYITEYIDNLENLLQKSYLLNTHFTERSAEELSKSLANHNLFEAQHKILLRNGRQVSSLEEWTTLVQQELNQLYQTPTLARTFERLKKLFSKNSESAKIRDIIVTHREIIPLLGDIATLKKQTWGNCFNRLERPFTEYYKIITGFKEEIHSLYEKASEQSARWEEVVREFNRRFRVPFTVIITNKSNFILKDEAPNIDFIYTRGIGDNKESTALNKENLMVSLSMGERRALYLLYILFVLEKIRKQAREGGGQYLIIADDISDSFDYKNKYAIIEYLCDLAETKGIDLLMLTHNFDFFRTVKYRCDVNRRNCYIAQRSADGVVNIAEFKYQSDFFKNVIRSSIQDGNLDSDFKKKCLIASIPFYRNLAEYSGNDSDFLKLTCCLHYKTEPFDTSRLMVSDIWGIISKFLDNSPLRSANEPYLQLLHYLSNSILEDNDEVSLENKLVLSIAARIEIEKFMKAKIIQHEGTCPDATNNQTRDWFNKAKQYLTDAETETIEEINLVTPENIHLNAFMYEPLIDISSWNLKETYRKAIALQASGQSD